MDDPGLDPRWAPPTSVRIPLSLLAGVDAHAVHRGTNRSDVIVTALREWLGENPAPSGDGQLELFGDG